MCAGRPISVTPNQNKLGKGKHRLEARKKSIVVEEPSVQPSPEAESLDQSHKLARRNGSAGLQLIMHATNSLYSLFMSAVHDSIYLELPLVESAAEGSMCCGLLDSVMSIVSIVRAQIQVVVERGFAAVAVLRGTQCYAIQYKSLDNTYQYCSFLFLLTSS